MSYRIGDEPQPGPLAQVAVNPVWPLLVVMFGGADLSWPWFALNSLASAALTAVRSWPGWSAASPATSRSCC